jgi:hypothetical protein
VSVDDIAKSACGKIKIPSLYQGVTAARVNYAPMEHKLSYLQTQKEQMHYHVYRLPDNAGIRLIR